MRQFRHSKNYIFSGKIDNIEEALETSIMSMRDCPLCGGKISYKPSAYDTSIEHKDCPYEMVLYEYDDISKIVFHKGGMLIQVHKEGVWMNSDRMGKYETFSELLVYLEKLCLL